MASTSTDARTAPARASGTFAIGGELRVHRLGLGAMMPWAPIRTRDRPVSSDALSAVAARHGATPAQIALAWLLRRSPAVLPIPGTSSPAHMRENIDAALIELSEDDVTALAPPS